MSELSVARRYAKSLLDLAIEEKKLEKIISDSKLLSSALESRDLYLLLKLWKFIGCLVFGVWLFH